MPVIFRYRGYRFHFFSNEGNPREPIHIHVMKGDADANFWLHPVVHVAYNRGFNARTLTEIAAIVASRKAEIERAWNEHFG